MNVLDSLKEHVKELYHDGIRTVGKFVAPVALAGALGFISACSQPSTPPRLILTPEEVKCNSWLGGVTCYQGNKTLLKFEPSIPNSKFPIGQEIQFNVLVTSDALEYTRGNEVPIQYSIGQKGVKQNERKIFAIVPVGREVTLPFKPENPECFWFYIDDIDEDKLRLTFGPSKVSILNFGKPTYASLGVDKYETTTYNPIKIYAEITPSHNVHGWLRTVKGGEYKNYDINSSPFQLLWIPSEGPGTYEIFLDVDADSTGCEYISSKTNPIKIIVR